MLSRKLFRTNCNRVRLVRRRDIFGGVGGIKLHKLRARRQLGRWVERLLGLFGRHLPGCNGGFELHQLCPGDVFGVGRERLFELFGGNLSVIFRRV